MTAVLSPQLHCVSVSSHAPCGTQAMTFARGQRAIALGIALVVALGLASSAVLLLPALGSLHLPQRSMLGLEHEFDYEPDVEFMLMGGLAGPANRSSLPANRSLLATPEQPLTATELLTLQHYSRYARRYLEVGCRRCRRGSSWAASHRTAGGWELRAACLLANGGQLKLGRAWQAGARDDRQGPGVPCPSAHSPAAAAGSPWPALACHAVG